VVNVGCGPAEERVLLTGMGVYSSKFAGNLPGKDKDCLGKDKDFQVYSWRGWWKTAVHY
jgi:hypothetical protein